MENKYKISTIRSLIDDHFSLQWCRENVVIPIKVEPSLPPKNQVITIAVGNIVYLGTIGNTITQRIANNGFDCVFVQLPPDEIQSLLDKASDERLFNSQGIENYDFNEDDVIKSLLDATEEEGAMPWGQNEHIGNLIEAEGLVEVAINGDTPGLITLIPRTVQIIIPYFQMSEYAKSIVGSMLGSDFIDDIFIS